MLQCDSGADAPLRSSPHGSDPPNPSALVMGLGVLVRVYTSFTHMSLIASYS